MIPTRQEALETVESTIQGYLDKTRGSWNGLAEALEIDHRTLYYQVRTGNRPWPKSAALRAYQLLANAGSLATNPRKIAFLLAILSIEPEAAESRPEVRKRRSEIRKNVTSTEGRKKVRFREAQ